MLDNYILYSGGAEGSDTMWELIGKAYGLKTAVHYYHGSKITPRGNTPITEEQYWRGVKAVDKAQKTLMRFGIEKYLSLLARNWMQVESSTAVFAIADNFTKTPGGEVVINGGTGWAVQMAIDANKPCYVFVQQLDKWMSYHTIMNKWCDLDSIPLLHKKFAGIGTRNLKPNGIKAIIDIYDKTTKELTLFDFSKLQ
jgi:hypothetical protein|nr:MAG TPA: YspA [Caudoviricetes sp.]